MNVWTKKVLHISADQEGGAVWIMTKNTSMNQRWTVTYTTETKITYIRKGHLDKGFGFLVNEPFYLRSKLPMQRVMEAVGANNVVIKKWVKNKT